MQNIALTTVLKLKSFVSEMSGNCQGFFFRLKRGNPVTSYTFILLILVSS